MEKTMEKKNACPMEKNLARLEKMRATLAKLEDLDEIASKIECWEDYFPTFERVWDAVKRTAEDR